MLDIAQQTISITWLIVAGKLENKKIIIVL